MAHSILSPSSASTYFKCPKSPSMCKDLPNQTNEFAQYGTDCHNFLDNIINKEIINNDYKEFLASDYTDLMPEDKVEDLTFAIDSIKEVLVKDDYNYVKSETRYAMKSVHKDLFGTCDLTIAKINKDKTVSEIIIIDYKFGRLEVKAKNNEQLQLYMLGAMELLNKEGYKIDYGYTTLNIGIIQPKLQILDIWRVNFLEMIQFHGYAKSRCELVFDDLARFNPSLNTCKYCRANMVCTPFLDYARKTIEKQAMSDNSDNIEFLLENSSNVSKVLKDAEAHVVNELLAGKEFKDYAVKERRGHSKWAIEAEDLEKLLSEKGLDKKDYVDEKLKTPSQVKKVLKDEDLEAFIERPHIGYKLFRQKEDA